MRQSIFVIAIVAGSVAGTQAQQRANVPIDTITIVSADQLQTLLKTAPASPTRKAGDLSTQLFPGAASCSFIRLSEPDLPHVHPVSEIYVIQEGSGELETEGTMIGPFFNGGVHNLPANGAASQADQVIGPDHGGQSLQGGKKQAVKAGDIIVVPAGVNHHWTKVDKPIVYLDIKFPKVAAR